MYFLNIHIKKHTSICDNVFIWLFKYHYEFQLEIKLTLTTLCVTTRRNNILYLQKFVTSSYKTEQYSNYHIYNKNK